MLFRSKREVIGYMGSGGNHLRWLLLLDPSFVLPRGTSQNNYDFIIQDVYSFGRTWQNWLNYEWRWRLEVEDLIAFSHGRVIQSDIKYCALKTDPDAAFKHYLKFNTNLNTTLIDTFKRKTMEYNDTIVAQSVLDNVLIIDSEGLFQPQLDTELYNQVVEWFELDNLYDQASEIHTKWYNLIKRAEQDIITDLQIGRAHV